MTDLERIIAEHADVTTDARGRKSYEFDEHGIRAFIAALAGAAPVLTFEVKSGGPCAPSLEMEWHDDYRDFTDKGPINLFTHALAGAAPVATVRNDSGLTITADRLPFYTGKRIPAGTQLFTYAPAKAREDGLAKAAKRLADIAENNTDDGDAWHAAISDVRAALATFAEGD